MRKENQVKKYGEITSSGMLVRERKREKEMNKTFIMQESDTRFQKVGMVCEPEISDIDQQNTIQTRRIKELVPSQEK